MAADYLELSLLFEHSEDLETTAERVASTLGVSLVRVVADGFPDDRSQDRFEGSALGLAISLRGKDRPTGRRYRLTGATRSQISVGREGRVSLDEPVRTLLRAAGFEPYTLQEARERKKAAAT
ncbi:MAG: hypothetical protein AB8H79_11710 [Myxococcota bacterium]